jgi:hypothetical protein
MKTAPQLEITEEWLDQHLARAAYCVNATVPGEHFDAIFHLAIRPKAFIISGLDRLRKKCGQDEVEIDGNDFQILLMLASQAKRARLKPRLKLVRAQTCLPKRV